jgi:hypothetical protein
MTTPLRQEIERWETGLGNIAESNTADSWYLEERRLAEAQHTLATYRGRIVPLVTTQTPYDAIVADEITHLLDRLQDLRNDLFQTVHPPTSHQELAETIAALRALTHITLRFEQILQDAR